MEALNILDFIISDMDATERLENWRAGHKSRSVQISVDDGYGATCWTVKLWGNGKSVEAAECSFWEYDPSTLPENVVYLMGEDDDWPGLAAVIHAAIDRAEKLGL